MAHQSPQAGESVLKPRTWRRYVIVLGVVIGTIALIVELKKAVSELLQTADFQEQQKVERIARNPERFTLGKPEEWILTVSNLDSVTFEPASYKIWANKAYKAATTDPRTNRRIERIMPSTPKYWYGAPGGIGHLEVSAIDSGTVFMAQRVM